MNKEPFVRAADVQGEYRTPPRVSKLLLAPKFGGVEHLSMGMNITEVGSMIPDHVHENSEEVLFLISGHAKIVIDGIGEWEIGPETAFYSPLGKKHRVENIGDEPAAFLSVKAPKPVSVEFVDEGVPSPTPAPSVQVPPTAAEPVNPSPVPPPASAPEEPEVQAPPAPPRAYGR